MFPRALALPALLAASVAVPYVASNAPKWSRERAAASSQADSTLSSIAQAGRNAAMLDDATPKYRLPPQGPGLYPTQTPIEGIPTYALEEVMRMDVSKEWVYQRWARKSTMTSDLQWFGVRVPLVSGTQIHDVAGALTYYFDEAGQVQKILFRGRTGDTSQLVQLASGPYAMSRSPAPPGEQLYQLRRGADVVSELWTRPAPVLWESSPHDSFAVELTLQRLETGRPLTRTDAALQKILKEQSNALAVKEKAAQDALVKQEKAKQVAGDSETGVGGDEKQDGEGWKVFFPRSRVPKPQIESLDKRRSFW